MQPDDRFDRCLEMITLLNRENDWLLLEHQQQQYAAALVNYISDKCSAAKLQLIISNYHEDHARVDALLRSHGKELNDAWAEWMPWVMSVLQQAGLTWSVDKSVSSEDLAQIALTELFRSIGNFRYASRFSTWAYAVVVQSIRRHIRDRHTKKRAGQAESLEELGALDQEIKATEEIEVDIAGYMLYEKVRAILAKQSDKRLLVIFNLAILGDIPVQDIGRLVRLHPSRVRALLQQARAVLRNHPDLSDWLER